MLTEQKGTQNGKNRSDHRLSGSRKDDIYPELCGILMGKGENIGILENDFGAVNVDMMLLQDLEGEHCELGDGFRGL